MSFNAFAQKVFLTLFLSFSCAAHSDTLEVDASTYSEKDFFEVLAGEIALGQAQGGIAYQAFSDVASRLKSAEIAEKAWNIALLSRSQKHIDEASSLWLSIDPSAESPRLARLELAFLADSKNEREIYKELQQALMASEHPEKTLDFLASGLISSKVDPVLLNNIFSLFYPTLKTNPYSNILKAKILSYNKKHIEACQIAFTIPSTKTKDIDTLKSAIDICWKIEPQKSLTLIENFLSQNPNHSEFRLTYARALSKLKRTTEARQEINKVTRSKNLDPTTLFQAGQVALDLQQINLAKRLFEKLIKFYPNKRESFPTNLSEVWIYLGKIESYFGNFDKALIYYQTIQSGHFYREARLLEANLLLQTKDSTSMHEMLTVARKKDPTNRSAYLSLEAELLLSQGLSNQAENLLSAQAQKYPTDINIIYAQSSVAWALGKEKETELFLSKVLDLDPKNTLASNDLGYLYCTQQKKIPQARKLIAFAYAQEPNNPNVLDSLGCILMLDNNYEKAYQVLVKSLQTQFNSEVAIRLLQVISLLGRDEEAKEFYKQLLIKTKNNPKVLETGEQLGL